MSGVFFVCKLIITNIYFHQNENDIEPKKWAVKYNPAKIALEYYLKPFKSNYLLEIELEEKIKSLSSAQKIADLLYKTYPDILIKSLVPESQLINLLNKVIAIKKSQSKYNTQMPSPSNKNVNPINTTEVYPLKHNLNTLNHLNQNNNSLSSISSMGLNNSLEIDESKKIDYSKSNQNFFSTGKNANINFIDQTYPDEDIKAELEQLNKKNRYSDEEKTDNSQNKYNSKAHVNHVIHPQQPQQNDSEVNLKLTSSHSVSSNNSGSNKRVDRYID